MKAQKNAKHQAKQKTQKKGTKKKKGEWTLTTNRPRRKNEMDSDTEMAQPKKAASRPRATVKATMPKMKKAPATKAPATKVSSPRYFSRIQFSRFEDGATVAEAAPKAVTAKLPPLAKPAKKAAACPKAPECDPKRATPTVIC
jgi:hypothetical protein